MRNTRFLPRFCPLLALATLVALTSGAQSVTQVAEGNYHSLFLKSDGSLWAMGDNNYGQLGDGTLNATNRPEFITNNVAAVAAKTFFSLFLKGDGSVWAMGVNADGQFGDGTDISKTNGPELIMSGNVTAIAAGSGFILLLKNDGSLWAAGDDSFGELGDGNTNASWTTNRFEEVVSNNVTAISCGETHSLFLKNNGSLWGMGGNSSGQLGLVGINQTNQPTLIVASNVVAISAGFLHSLFVKNDGSLWGMGDNSLGALGPAPGGQTNPPAMIISNNVSAIAGGNDTTFFIKSDSSLWGMGFNYYGQLGLGTAMEINLPELVSSNASNVGAGSEHSLLAKKDGSLWASGSDEFGQLGDGNNSSGVNQFEQILNAPPTYKISFPVVLNGNVQFSFGGIAGSNYALDRCSSLISPNWAPQQTNVAWTNGIVWFTNTPVKAANNFWRVRSVP